MTEVFVLALSVTLIGLLCFLLGVFYGYVHGRHDERFNIRQEGR